MKRLAAASVLVLVGCGGHHNDPSVVRVELKGATSAAETATGLVAAPGRVVTVAHVLDPSRRLVIRADGRSISGRVLRVDLRDDLALVAAPGLRGSSAALHPRIGAGAAARILVLRDGKPASIAARIRRPIRATVRTPTSGPYRRRALEVDGHVRLGDSGAPVVDGDGRIAGVVFARASNGSPTVYAVDASAIHKLFTR